MTALRSLIRDFAGLLTPDETTPARLETWIRTARSADLPHVHSFARGLGQDHEAVLAAPTKPPHKGRTVGANTRTKMLKRQMRGHAGFNLLRHRILFG